ncbi:MAG: cytochrome c family protein [Thermoanaerobaculia bacterium]|nr:cytochrome c family protein [Thermoanaerobaculia bacterium]
MAQIFPGWTNRVPIYIALAAVGAALVVPGMVWYFFSPEFTDVGYQPKQPVPYSHALHVGELNLDCRYCHANVERSSVASIPPTQTCMNCHTLVGQDRPTLDLVRASAKRGEPLRWVRVHKVPEYAYFPHDSHIAAGVGCSSCHGDVASMEVITLVKSLSMGWCLDCHRDPTQHIRPMEEVTNTRWQPPEDQATVAAALIAERGLAPPEECGACHR